MGLPNAELLRAAQVRKNASLDVANDTQPNSAVNSRFWQEAGGASPMETPHEAGFLKLPNSDDWRANRRNRLP